MLQEMIAHGPGWAINININISRVWMNHGPERGHQAVKKELGALYTGYNITFSTVTSSIFLLQGREGQLYFL